MKKQNNQPIVYFVLALSLVLTTAVGVLTWMLLSKTDHVNNNAASLSKTEDVELPPPKEDRQSKLQRLFDDIDRLSRQRRLERQGRFSSFSKIPDEEKNRIWWEIGNVALVRGSNPPRYNVTAPLATKISTKYGPSEVDVYLFFREGATADWRTDLDPSTPAKKKSNQL